MPSRLGTRRRVMTYLTDQQHQALKKLSKDRTKTVAQLVREAVIDMLTKEGRT